MNSTTTMPQRVLTVIFMMLLAVPATFIGTALIGTATAQPASAVRESSMPTLSARTDNSEDPALDDTAIDASVDIGSAPADVLPQTGKAVPRVMLTAFSTNPATVTAGEKFTVNVSLKNMSHLYRVSNLKLTVSGTDDGFLPVGGSSSRWIDAIPAGREAHRSVEFRSLATLEDRPYQMNLTVDYEDSEFNQYSVSEVVSVVVQQPMRLAASTVEVMPEEIEVGQEAALSFSINNLGKAKMYNVRANLKETPAATAPEAFIGTIEPGTTGQVEMLVTGLEETTEPVTVVVSYEDAEGNESTQEYQAELAVLEMLAEDFDDDLMMMEEPEPTVPWVLILLAAVVLIIAITVAIVLIVRRRKKRAAAQELSDDTELLDTTLI